MSPIAIQQHRQFSVETPLGEDALLLYRMDGTEALSGLPAYELELLSEHHEIDLDALLGQNITVRMKLNDEVRVFSGYVSRSSQMAPFGRYARYQLTMVPWLWFLTLSTDCRIYQNQSVPEIVKEVLREHGYTDVEERFVATYEPREYCVQYRESCYSFISRLLEDEGIYFYFEHRESTQQLVLCDSPAAHTEFGRYGHQVYLPYAPEGNRSGHVYRWKIERQVQPGQCALRDFDFATPRKDLLVRSGPQDPPAHAHNDLEVFDYPGGYHHHDSGVRRARIRIEELHARQDARQARSVHRGIVPGYRFRLSGHDREDQNVEYLVIGARYQLRSNEFESTVPPEEHLDFDCEFTVIPANKQYRPARVTPRPVVEGPQTAIVVGKSDEEIWTDELAQIKVQFHWDRYGLANETNSGWVRVAQSLADKRSGTIHIPRIGQEVVVAFLEGDPDRPIVTGCVYNGTHRPPFSLPEAKTVSGTKTNSHQGEGYNELSFDDKADQERVTLHAQRDFNARTENDVREWVGNSRHLVVKRDLRESVEVDLHQKVGRDHRERIGRDCHTDIRGKEAKRVAGGLSLSVQGNVTEIFKKCHSEEVTEDYFLKAMNVVLESMGGITLRCGSSSIVLDATGVSITGSALTFDGQMIRLASGPGSPPQEGVAGRVVLPAAPEDPEDVECATPGDDSPESDDSANASARSSTPPFVPGLDPGGEDDPTKTWIEIELLDEDGLPIPGEAYEIHLPDGRLASGTLDENGFARIEGIDPGDCTIHYPNLDELASKPD